MLTRVPQSEGSAPFDDCNHEPPAPPVQKAGEKGRAKQRKQKVEVKTKKNQFLMWNCCDGRNCKEDGLAALFNEEPEMLSPVSPALAPPRWEILSVTVDSGAADSVMPESKCCQYEVVENPKSLAGSNCSGADGSAIPNLGERTIDVVTEAGNNAKMRFQVCPVTKALGSVLKMVRNGHRVVFDDEEYGEGSYIQDRRTGQKTYLRQENGVFVLDVWVRPKQPVFARQE